MTISIDTNVSELIKLKYPRQISRICEDNFRALLELDIEEKKFDTKNSILSKLKELEDKKMKNNVEIGILQRDLEGLDQKQQEVVNEQKVISKEKYFELDNNIKLYFGEIYNRLKDSDKLPDPEMFVVGYYDYVCNNKIKEYTRLASVFKAKPNLQEGLRHLIDKCKVFQ